MLPYDRNQPGLTAFFIFNSNFRPAEPKSAQILALAREIKSL
jgi:hypothetical protein